MWFCRCCFCTLRFLIPPRWRKKKFRIPWMARNFTRCAVCEQRYEGEPRLRLAEVRARELEHLPPGDVTRLDAATNVGEASLQMGEHGRAA